MKKKVLLIILILIIAAQFIQPPHNSGVAAAETDITHVVQVPDTVLALLKHSCYDCHSNHTDYPWYSKITPVNWWLNNHVNEGKAHLNFSTFSTYEPKKMDKKLDESAELIEKGAMPIHSYTWIHKTAVLNEAQRKLLVDWIHTAQGQINPVR
jgi:Haem-binding domain